MESIQDEAYVGANQRFIRQEWAATNALFDEVEAEMDTEADAEEPGRRPPPMYPEPGTKIVDICDDD